MLTTQPLSVSEVTSHLKRLLERDEILQDVTVRGEISNFTRHSSGHLYFSLKDQDSTIGCVCFRGVASKLRFEAGNGMRVIADGAVSVYEKQGRYQLMVRALRPDGVGDLAAALEKLKAKLEAEGLFAPERKRPLPRFPVGIGLITSPTGAAIRDLISVISRRYPLSRIVVIPTVVQGEAGAGSICAAIRYANTLPNLDVLIVGRGGGSLEDLWCFNEEPVARAIFASRLPVISAVGHESDFSIADLVADIRAATPSAAAELVCPDIIELQRHLEAVGRHLQAGVQGHIARAATRYQAVATQPLLQRPTAFIEARALRVDDASSSMAEAVNRLLRDNRRRLEKASVGLSALSPLSVLGRGYAIVRREADGRVVRSIADAAPQTALTITVADGDLPAVAQ
ncbi:MAG: exodeoxyribonuclease VII large subunit [Armatimonadota bacterium]